jgi:hypothetical protein
MASKILQKEKKFFIFQKQKRIVLLRKVISFLKSSRKLLKIFKIAP